MSELAGLLRNVLEATGYLSDGAPAASTVTLAGVDPPRQAIRTTLYNQIHGVDVSREAVRIAAFSRCGRRAY